jgi:hypothetical protein
VIFLARRSLILKHEQLYSLSVHVDTTYGSKPVWISSLSKTYIYNITSPTVTIGIQDLKSTESSRTADCYFPWGLSSIALPPTPKPSCTPSSWAKNRKAAKALATLAARITLRQTVGPNGAATRRMILPQTPSGSVRNPEDKIATIIA